MSIFNRFKKKQKTPAQIRKDKRAKEKAEKEREAKRQRELSKIKHQAEMEEQRARVQRAKAEKVSVRNERLRQLPVVGRAFNTSSRSRATTHRRKRTKVLGRGSGWGL